MLHVNTCPGSAPTPAAAPLLFPSVPLGFGASFSGSHLTLSMCSNEWRAKCRTFECSLGVRHRQGKVRSQVFSLAEVVNVQKLMMDGQGLRGVSPSTREGGSPSARIETDRTLRVAFICLAVAGVQISETTQARDHAGMHTFGQALTAILLALSCAARNTNTRRRGGASQFSETSHTTRGEPRVRFHRHRMRRFACSTSQGGQQYCEIHAVHRCTRSLLAARQTATLRGQRWLEAHARRVCAY